VTCCRATPYNHEVKRARWPWLLLGLILAGGCIRNAPLQPRPAPAFDLPALNGGRVSLDSLKGKVVVLDFWATWCNPCLAEIPEYAELWRKNQGRGVEIVGVACESDPQDVRDLAQAQRIPYRVLMGDDRVSENYGASGLPTTYVIDKHGLIRKRLVGMSAGKFKTLQQTVDELLAAQS
jgi:cytochrome c biogenesis protein CcmG, thiol:disulfide interchange protein DsbE